MAQTDATASVTATVVGLTDVGRVREHNEDAFLVLDRAANRRAANGEVLDCDLRNPLILAVCDGMGGAAAGEVASRMATDQLATDLGAAEWGGASPDQVAALVDHAVQQANQNILEAAKKNPEMKGMGTTMTAAVAVDGRLFVSQVGDSRAYLLRKGHLNQLTKDQSLIGQLIEEGTLTEEEAEKLGGRNIVLQAVGVEENLRVDTKDWPILRGDLLFLCSDGLSGMVKDAKLREILTEHGADLRVAAEKMIAEANQNGGRDNITVVAVRFEGEGLRPPMEALADGAVERAGAGFKAPPPPDVPNPMRKVAIVGIAVLIVLAALFFVLRPTTAELQIGVRPSTIPVELVLQADGKQAAKVTAQGGSVRIPGVPPGKYQLLSSADGYFDRTTDLEIDDTGTVKLDLHLMPKPGQVSVVSATPGVMVSLKAPGSHPEAKAYAKEVELLEAGKRREFQDIPAGPVHVSAARVGFRAFGPEERTLEPDGELTIEIPEMAAVMGKLMIRSPEDRVKVTVVDEGGKTLAEGTIENGQLQRDVRVGRHWVRWEKKGYRPGERQVDVAEGQPTRVELALEVETIQVTFTGAPGTRFFVEIVQHDGSWAASRSGIIQSGTSRAQSLEPGNYRARFSAGTEAERVKTFEVRVGDPPKEIRLE